MKYKVKHLSYSETQLAGLGSILLRYSKNIKNKRMFIEELYNEYKPSYWGSREHFDTAMKNVLQFMTERNHWMTLNKEIILND